MGEEQDRPFQIACLLYEMGSYTQALTYFERSIKSYGQVTATLFNMALSCHVLEKHEPAQILLLQVLKFEPDNDQAKAFLAGYQA